MGMRDSPVERYFMLHNNADIASSSESIKPALILKFNIPAPKA